MTGPARLIRPATPRAAGRDERGFVLLYVLLVVLVITGLVAGALAVSAESIRPAAQSSYDEAAQAAAQGGLQAALAAADRLCTGTDEPVAQCAAVLAGAPAASRPQPVSAATATATYRWARAEATPDAVRVTALGTVAAGALSASKTLTADFAVGPPQRCFDYAVCTEYETQSPDVMAASFPQRTITFADQAGNPTVRRYADAVDGTSGTGVSWRGAPASGTQSAGGTVNTCNDRYADPDSPDTGRQANPAPGAATPFVDWSENGSLVGGSGANVTEYQPCQVTLGANTTIAASASGTGEPGGYYSADALLLSNSDPGGSGGPTFDEPVYTGYSAARDPAGTAGQDYRTFTLPGYDPQVGGTPRGTYAPQYVAQGPSQPKLASATPPAGACVYAGPTRVRLAADGSATITSPQTRAVVDGSPLACYGGSAPTTAGLFQVPVPNIAAVSHGVLWASNAGSAPTTPSCVSGGAPISTNTGWNVTCQQAGDTPGPGDTVFYASSGGSAGTTTTASATTTPPADKSYQPAVGDNPSTKPDGAWNPQWTHLSTTSTSHDTCKSLLDPTDLALYDCYQQGGSGAYAALKSTVRNAITASPAAYSTANALQSLVQGVVAAGDSPANSAQIHQWTATATSDSTATAGCTPASVPGTGPSTTTPTLSDDPLFVNTAGGTSSTTTTATGCYTVSVSVQVGTCVLVFGQCVLPIVSPPVPQFSVTFTVTTVTTNVTTTPARSYFPSMADVTQYGTATDAADAPGDLYVEGTPTASIALVSDDDTVITGPLAPAASAPTGAGIDVVAKDDIRIYHPVGCDLSTTTQSAIQRTTVGFCPNDITGLYRQIPPDGSRPYQQYTNLRPDLKGLAVTAVLDAVGRPASAANCPGWDGGGTCGGEVTVDNYGRGGTLGTLAVTGSIIEAHHGALGEEWEVPDTAGQTRPQSGYALTATYRDFVAPTQALDVLDVGASTTAAWHLVSVSTGGGQPRATPAERTNEHRASPADRRSAVSDACGANQ